MKLNLGQESEVNILIFKLSPVADVWSKFLSWCLVNILKIKLDQYLCFNLRYDQWPKHFGKLNSTLGSVVPLAMFSNHLYPGPCEIFVGRSAFLSDASSPTLTMLPLISRALTEYHRPFFFQTTPYRSIVPSFSQLLAGCPNAHGLSHPLCVRAQTITKRQKLSDASTT